MSFFNLCLLLLLPLLFGLIAFVLWPLLLLLLGMSLSPLSLRPRLGVLLRFSLHFIYVMLFLFLIMGFLWVRWLLRVQLCRLVLVFFIVFLFLMFNFVSVGGNILVSSLASLHSSAWICHGHHRLLHLASPHLSPLVHCVHGDSDVARSHIGCCTEPVVMALGPASSHIGRCSLW